jgi:exonuclease SbcC
MRIQRLSLHNYRSFSDCDLDLSSIHGGVLASGPTGSGKSTLIDAILWATFGKSRSRRADGFVKLGRDDCQVTVEFSVNGTDYRVTRTRSLKTKAGKSDLQLVTRNGAGWVPLTGKSILETESNIRRVVGVDYDVLTSGNFSLQGQADKFTKASVSDRISILSELLGLSIYQEWREAAGREARAVDQQAGTLEVQVADADGELVRREQVAADLATSEARIQEARTGAQAAQDSKAALEAEAQVLSVQIEAARAQTANLEADRKDLGEAVWSLTSKQAKRDSYRSLLDRRLKIESQAVRADGLDASLAEQRQELAAIAAEGKGIAEQVKTAEGRVAEADRKVGAASGKVAEAKRKVERRGELTQKVKRLAEARTERQECMVRIQNADSAITAQREVLDGIAKVNQETEKKRGEILAEEKRVNAEKAGLVPLITGHERRIGDMGNVPCLDVGDLAVRCPLLQSVRDSIAPLQRLREQQATVCAWVRPILPELLQTTAVDGLLRTLGAGKLKEQGILTGLDREIGILELAGAELASLDTIAATIPTLEAEDQAAQIDQQAASLGLKELRSSLETAKQRYVSIQAEIEAREAERATLQASVDLIPELALAERELPGLEVEIATLGRQASALEERARAAEAVAGALSVLSGKVGFIRAEIVQIALKLHGYEMDERMAIESAATHRASLVALDKLAGEREMGAAEAATLRTRHSLLVALELFYRQAPLMILENEAIPAIEEEANRLLVRISQSGMRIQLRTQREIKSRDTLADGLDIIVTDQVGEREYEAYSGGQQFQIDLALRVALAKLQARRAGACIETLVIDEGWGTQSSECLDSMVAALRAIQDEFPLLWCISHVEALRDVFPARIDVSGGPVDSRAELVTA